MMKIKIVLRNMKARVVQTFLCAHINWMYVSTLQIIDLFAILSLSTKESCYLCKLCLLRETPQLK